MAVESSSSSSSLKLNGRERERIEPKMKLKKNRSIRFSRVSISKASLRRSRSRFNWSSIDMSADDLGLQKASPLHLSDSSPNYMKNRSCSSAKRDGSQGGSEYEDGHSVDSSTYAASTNRLPAWNQDSNIKHRTGLKKTLRNYGSSRSFKKRVRSMATKHVTALSSDTSSPQHGSLLEASDASPSYLKATSSSKGKKLQFHAIPHSNDQSRNSHNTETKKASTKCSHISDDSAVDRATHSSKLKDSKLPELPPGEIESERISTIKVCPYHHCSLHGHSHEPSPPVKKFLYRRRRSMKTQMTMKQKSESGPRSKQKKHSNDTERELVEGQMSSSAESLIEDGPNTSSVHSSAEEEYKGVAIARSFEEEEFKGIDSLADHNTKPRVPSEGANVVNKNLDLIELIFGEMSYPEISYQDSLNQKRYRIVNKNDKPKCCCTERELDDSIALVSDSDSQDEDAAAKGPVNDHKTSSQHDEVSDFSDFQPSEILLKPDIQDYCKDDKDLNIQPDLTQGSNIENIGKEEKDSVSEYDKLEQHNASGEEKESNHGPNGNIVSGSTAIGDSEKNILTRDGESEHDASSQEVYTPKFNREKHGSLWYVIHHHMSSSLAKQSGNRTLQGDNEENQAEDVNVSPESPAEYSDSDAGNDAVNQELEIRKLFAIKLVREAIEKILLPEVQDQSSETHSTTSDVIPEQQFSDKMDSEVSTHAYVQEGEKNKERKVASTDTEVKGATTSGICNQDISKNKLKEEGNKPNKKAPRHWSNLKKWILLQRFVKALEKVKKLSSRKPKHLEKNPNSETEKVHLRHQTVDEKKRGEEWMLDNALRHAVGQLAPTQKKKVALLVKAFETVVPPQDHHVQVTYSRQKNRKDESDDTSNKFKDTKDVEGKRPSTHTKFEENDFFEPVINYSPQRSLSLASDYTDFSHEDLPDHARAKQVIEVKADNNSSSTAEAEGTILSNENKKFDGSYGENHYDGYSKEAKKLVSSSFGSSFLKILAQSVDKKERETEAKLVHLHGVDEGTVPDISSDNDPSLASNKYTHVDAAEDCVSEAPTVQAKNSSIKSDNEMSMTIDSRLLKTTSAYALGQEAAECEGNNTESDEKHDHNYGPPSPPQSDLKETGEINTLQPDKQKQILMWHMVYQNVISGIALKVGNQLIDGIDGEKEDDADMDGKETNGSPRDRPKVNDAANEGSESSDAVSSKRSLSRDEAIKLVREAVEEILQAQSQDDSSEKQSVTSDITTETGENISYSAEVNSEKLGKVEDEASLDQGKTRHAADPIKSKDDLLKEVTLPVQSKPELPKPRIWSKVKRMIILKRSIKALEEARTIRYQQPQYLPLEKSSEPEKVDLRNQMMDERKKAEQWMLDYAVRHIVTKLTPARKRRVAMLVEAFEAVIPFPEL